MLEVKMFSDGSCLKNPGGPGGYGVIVRYLKKGRLYEKKMSSGYEDTTNNRMELTAVLKGLELIPERGANITIYSDSKYVVDAFQKGWIEKWKALDWDRGKNGGLVKNSDLWKELLENLTPHTFSFVWVKGHHGHEENELCDKMAVNAARTQKGSYIEGYVKEQTCTPENSTSPSVKYHAEDGNTFKLDELLARKDTFVIIPIGSYNGEKGTGLCKVLLSYEGYQKVFSVSFGNCKSVNEITLRGVIDAVGRINFQKKCIAIVSGLALGFNNPKKSANWKYICKLSGDVNTMGNRIEIFEVKNGTRELKHIISRVENS